MHRGYITDIALFNAKIAHKIYFYLGIALRARFGTVGVLA